MRKRPCLPHRVRVVVHVNSTILEIPKCEKPTSRSCRRCERLDLDCAVTDEALARPHYHTSKEQFELMATIIRRFSPTTSMSVEDLRELVSQLPDRDSNSCAPAAQEPTPRLSVFQPTDSEAPEPTHAVDDIAPSVSDGDLSGAWYVNSSCLYPISAISGALESNFAPELLPSLPNHGIIG